MISYFRSGPGECWRFRSDTRYATHTSDYGRRRWSSCGRLGPSSGTYTLPTSYQDILHLLWLWSSIMHRRLPPPLSPPAPPRVLFRPLPCPSSSSTLVPTLSVPLQRCAVHLSSASFPSILAFYSRVRSSTVFYILENRSQANESAYYLRLEDTSAELRRKGVDECPPPSIYRPEWPYFKIRGKFSKDALLCRRFDVSPDFDASCPAMVRWEK